MTEEELALREQIEQRQKELGGLERSLDAANSELESLAAQKNQYGLLEEICEALLELDGLGVEHLFWGEQYDSGDTTEHVHKVRRRIELFNGKLAEIENRRQAIVGEMQGENESIDYLDDDLLDVLEKEESRKAEWLIETEERKIPYRASVMPWSRGGEEDQRLRRSLALSMLVSILLALLADLVQLPVPEFAELSEVPERVAQLIRQEREVPPPQPVVEEPVVEDEPIEIDPEEPLVAEEELPEEVIPEPAPSEEELRLAAREQVASKGILAFRDSFSSRAQIRPSAQLGSDARIGNAGEAAVGRPERSMVTTQQPGSSGGINLASLSRDIGGSGGQQITGVELTRVASSIGGGGGGSGRPMSGRPLAGRTDEEIQIVFDRYKAALYRLYNRELRKDPTLRGQLVLRLTIEPDGSVSLCELQSSDMDAPSLAQQIVTRVRGFDFGAKKDIVAMTIIYPIDFLPAA
jgi:hypothetical protein